jgi:tetratricopeptide (TPR) repeat protein
VVIRGEPGIGKSRVVHDFRDAGLARGARVIECFCSPLTAATALAPVIEAIGRMVAERAQGQSGPETRLVALANLMAEHAELGHEALPLMAALLSIPGADETPLRDYSPARRRARTLELIREWITSSTERVPLVMLVEDVHWADPSTLDLLDLLVDEAGGRTLLCVTARPEFALRWSNTHVRKVEMLRLSAAEIEAMVAHVALGHALPAVVVKRIAERSEGVPLFVEEVTKVVLESGALELAGDRYELVRPLDDRVLPPTVHGSLVARFDRLGDSRSVAHLGAAIGREFSYRLIRAVAGLPDAVLRGHLDRLSQSELAYVHGEAPASIYTFKHALIQDAIYGTLLKSERARVHDRIFSTMVREFPAAIADRPEVAAYHAEHAGRREAAVPLLHDAGTKALTRTAVAEAVKHLGHCIELVDVLDEPARSTMEIELQAAIGPAYMATVGWAAPEVERSSARLRELAATRGDGPRLFQAMWSLWTVYFLRGALDRALELAVEVLEMATATGDPMLRVAGHHAVGYTHFYRGEYQEAIRHADEGLAFFDLEREKTLASLFQLSSCGAMWCFRAQAHQMLGHAREAAESIARVDELDAQLRHPPSRVYFLCVAYYFRLEGDVAQVNTRALSARSLSAAEGFAFWVLVADILLGWVNARQGGDAAGAVETIAAARRAIHGGGTHLVEPEYASMHAETLLWSGRAEDAFRVAGDALAVARLGKQRHGEPELLRLQGEAAAAMGDRAGADARFREAITSARSMGALLLELRAALALTRLTSAEQERAELRAILQRFTDGFDRSDYREALALV